MALHSTFTTTHLQKNKKYGEVVSIIITMVISSISSRHRNRRTGTTIINKHENKNITLEGAVIWKGKKIGLCMRNLCSLFGDLFVKFSFLLTRFCMNIFKPKKPASLNAASKYNKAPISIINSSISRKTSL